MTELEEISVAQRIASDSEVFDFDKALELVREMPQEAEKLIRLREEGRERQEMLDRAFRCLHRAVQALR